MCAAVRRCWRAGLKREASWACFGGELRAFVVDMLACGGWNAHPPGVVESAENGPAIKTDNW